MRARVERRVHDVCARGGSPDELKRAVGDIMREELRMLALPDKVVEALAGMFFGGTALGDVVALAIGGGLWKQ